MRTTSIAALAVVTAAALLPLGVASGPPAASLPEVTSTADSLTPAATPRPPTMPPYPYATGPLSIDQSRVPGAFATVSTRVVHPKGKITVTFGGATSDVWWSVASMPGVASAGPCAQNSPQGRGGRYTCTFTLSSAEYYPRLPQWLTFTVGFTWGPSCFPGGCFQTTAFRAFIALLPAASSVLSGSVRDRDNRMLPNVPVSIAGMGRRYATATNGAGEFTALLPQGTWTVTPTGTWDPPSRVVALGPSGARADFKAPVSEVDFTIAGSRLVNGVDWTTADASGLVARSGVVTAHTASGTPLANRVVQLDAPYRDGQGPGAADRPRIVACDATWRSLFTTAERAERITDGNGQVPFTLLLGNEAGTFLWHTRLRDDVTALDVERIGLTSTAEKGPSVPDITELMQKGQSLGLAKPPVSAISLAALQTGLVEWWLAYRASPWAGPSGAKHTGDFVPIRSADGRAAAIAFYPAGDPGPLRSHLLSGAPLPAGYPTAVLQFRQVLLDIYTGKIMGWAIRLDSLPDVATWEAGNGAAVPGYLLGAAGIGNGWLGGPIPPPATDRTARAAYARCVPGAAPPSAVVEVHSPVRVTLPPGSGAFVLSSSARAGTSYLVPAAATLGVTGTGTGLTRVVVRRGSAASTFSFVARRGVSGAVGIATAGVPSRMSYARASVRAVAGVPLLVTGVPTRLSVGRTARVVLRATDLFGVGVRGLR